MAPSIRARRHPMPTGSFWLSKRSMSWPARHLGLWRPWRTSTFNFSRAFTRQVDTTLETPRLNDDIVQALASLRNDIAPDASAQVVLKTLLRVFFEAAQANLTQVTTADIFEDKTRQPHRRRLSSLGRSRGVCSRPREHGGPGKPSAGARASRATIGLAPGDAVSSGADLGSTTRRLPP